MEGSISSMKTRVLEAADRRGHKIGQIRRYSRRFFSGLCSECSHRVFICREKGKWLVAGLRETCLETRGRDVEKRRQARREQKLRKSQSERDRHAQFAAK